MSIICQGMGAEDSVFDRFFDSPASLVAGLSFRSHKAIFPKVLPKTPKTAKLFQLMRTQLTFSANLLSLPQTLYKAAQFGYNKRNNVIMLTITTVRGTNGRIDINFCIKGL